MKVVIHDLGEKYNERIKGSCDAIINADGRYAPCQGCFCCWTKHPAKCAMKDSLNEVCRVKGCADELVIISKNFYGGYCPEVKNVLDRSIGMSTPFSTYRGGQMHHTLRYGKKDKLSVYVHGDITEAEKATFELMAKRNAINFGYREASVVFLDDISKLEGESI